MCSRGLLRAHTGWTSICLRWPVTSGPALPVTTSGYSTWSHPGHPHPTGRVQQQAGATLALMTYDEDIPSVLGANDVFCSDRPPPSSLLRGRNGKATGLAARRRLLQWRAALRHVAWCDVAVHQRMHYALIQELTEKTPGDTHMSQEQPTIIYTLTDEAPLLTTYGFLPIIRTFTDPAGINSRDQHLRSPHPGRVPRLPDRRAARADNLGDWVHAGPGINIIKLPNISASVPQLYAAIKELQEKGYEVPDYPAQPKTDEEKEFESATARFSAAR